MIDPIHPPVSYGFFTLVPYQRSNGSRQKSSWSTQLSTTQERSLHHSVKCKHDLYVFYLLISILIPLQVSLLLEPQLFLRIHFVPIFRKVTNVAFTYRVLKKQRCKKEPPKMANKKGCFNVCLRYWQPSLLLCMLAEICRFMTD